MPFGSDVVPEEWMTTRDVVGVAGRAFVRRVLGEQGVERVRPERDERVDVLRDVLARGDLAVAAERDDRAGAGLPAHRLDLGGVEHRRQRREHGAAVQAAEHRDGGLDRVAPEQDDDVARLHAGGGEPRGERERRAAQFRVRHGAVVEHERRRAGPRCGARGEVLPQVPGAPVALRVEARGLGLEAQRGHPQFLSPVSLVDRRRPRRPIGGACRRSGQAAPAFSTTSYLK